MNQHGAREPEYKNRCASLVWNILLCILFYYNMMMLMMMIMIWGRKANEIVSD
jgi:hypothetical protein